MAKSTKIMDPDILWSTWNLYFILTAERINNYIDPAIFQNGIF